MSSLLIQSKEVWRVWNAPLLHLPFGLHKRPVALPLRLLNRFQEWLGIYAPTSSTLSMSFRCCRAVKNYNDVLRTLGKPELNPVIGKAICSSALLLSLVPRGELGDRWYVKPLRFLRNYQDDLINTTELVALVALLRSGHEGIALGIGASLAQRYIQKSALLLPNYVQIPLNAGMSIAYYLLLGQNGLILRGLESLYNLMRLSTIVKIAAVIFACFYKAILENRAFNSLSNFPRINFNIGLELEQLEESLPHEPSSMKKRASKIQFPSTRAYLEDFYQRQIDYHYPNSIRDEDTSLAEFYRSNLEDENLKAKFLMIDQYATIVDGFFNVPEIKVLEMIIEKIAPYFFKILGVHSEFKIKLSLLWPALFCGNFLPRPPPCLDEAT